MTILAQTSARTHISSSFGSLFQQMAGRWSDSLFHLLAVAGAVTVIVGSHMTWATFYAGLIERNGMPGHGKYFVALAAGSIVALGFAVVPGVSKALRWLPLAAGITIAAVAFRDLRNLNALISDPAAGFYVPGRGDGLYVVLAGAALLACSVFVRGDMPRLSPMSLTRTLIALLVVGGVAASIAGGYGEYYLHISSGHAQNHTDTLNSAHLLTAGGAFALVAAGRFVLVSAILERRRYAHRQPEHLALPS